MAKLDDIRALLLDYADQINARSLVARGWDLPAREPRTDDCSAGLAAVIHASDCECPTGNTHPCREFETRADRVNDVVKVLAPNALLPVEIAPSDRNKRGELMSTAETLYERAWKARAEAVEQLKPHILERLGKASGNRMTLKSLVRGARCAAVALDAIDAAIIAAKLARFEVTLADIVHGAVVALMNDKIVGYAYRNVNEKPSERTYKLVNSLINHKE